MKSIGNPIGRLFILCAVLALPHHVYAQIVTTSGTTSPDTTNVDWSTASDLQVMLQTVEQTPPLPPSAVPHFGTFYSAQHAPGSADAWPPLPANVRGTAVWDLGDNFYLLDDKAVNYSAKQIKQTKSAAKAGTMMAMEMPSPGGGGSGGGTNDFNPGIAPQDYGTNLWIANFALSSTNATGVLSNSTADIQYEIQYKNDLITDTQWQSGGFILGSELTNWTSLVMTNASLTNNAFFRIRSWASSDGSGLPDWWELQYFGTTGIDPNAQDPAGDGWTIWQDFKAGYNPWVFHTPPTPQDLTFSYNPTAGTVTFSWLPSPGPVTSYTIRVYGVSSTFATNINVSAGATSIQIPVSGLTPYDVAFGGPNVRFGFQLQANYSGGSSALTSYDGLGYEEAYPPMILLPGAQNSAYLVMTPSLLPPGTASIRLTHEDFYTGGLTDFDIPLSAFVNGIYPIPTNWFVNPWIDSRGPVSFWWGATLNASGGVNSDSVNLTYGYYFFNTIGEATNGWMIPPFYDGRVQLKQNLVFKLRAAVRDYPFAYTYNLPYNFSPFVAYADNCVVADYLHGISGGQFGSIFDAFWPFEENTQLRNFVFSLADAAPNSNWPYNGFGHLSTGIFGNYGNYQFSPQPMSLTEPETYLFRPTTPLGGTIPALLPAASTQWLGSYPLDSPELYYDPNTDSMVSYGYLEEIGVTPSVQTDWETYYNTFETMAANSRNYWGLTNVSAAISYPNSGDTAATETTLFAGGQLENVDGDFYPETAQPVFQTVEYDFWNPRQYWNNSYYGWLRDELPGSTNFSTSSTGDVLITAVGNSNFQAAGYAKMAVLNGYPGVYGYLGQYFDQAYAISNGIVTTNTTGVLSPYGYFFATQPGLAALVTMPDVDTGARGTCTVYCVSLVLDKNHDGNMDLSFNGPDTTSQNSPYVFWANNNFDRWKLDADDNTNYMDDVQLGFCPYTPGTPTPDCNYRDQYGNRVIPTTRDLQDFFRLWVCGIDTNLLAKLPSGSTITLNWGDLGSPNSANPTIDLFQASDADGGIEYLTNETAAANQINPVYAGYVGRVAPGQSIQLNSSFFSGWAGNHFVICGVSNGIGGLNLIVKDGSGNVLGQATTYLQIVDVKQMYERWTVGDNPTNAPLNVAEMASEDLPVGVPSFHYANPGNSTTPYILYVHGWNMERWEKDRFAETAFKRLYWQGYQGRFGEFRWPTSWGFTGDFGQLVTDPQEKDNFDNSENFAWLAGTGLLNKLNDLNAQYPGQVYVLAHSMGNIVTGEALRLAGNNQLVNTYVASQAAVTAHVYDETVPNYSFYVTIGNVQFNFGPHTPNIYDDWFTSDNGGGAGKIVNFYNANDYALSQLHWQLDQLVKPDILVVEGGALWNYGYNGSPTDLAPWNNFYKTNVLTSARVNFDIVNNAANRYEVMSYAAQAYTTALGATPGVTTMASLNLATIWPSPDPLDSNYASHFFHSAEFRGDSVWEWNYWRTVLSSPQFGFNISSP